jgi:hypothetical protein
MIAKDRDQFIALADKLGYEINNFVDSECENQLVKKPESETVEEIEMTKLFLVKRTTYSKAQG